jgi:Fic family protein
MPLSERAGKFIVQDGGYRAFFPKLLPPEPPIQFTDEMMSLYTEADRALAKLDGITTFLPNPDLFIAMYVKKEALMSSQIEGTQATLPGILEFEADLTPKEDINDIKDVVNYIKALNYLLSTINGPSLSKGIIKKCHEILVTGVRGKDKQPGEFRDVQNLVGSQGVSLMDATYVPPPPDYVVPSVEALLQFIERKDDIRPLVKIALVHAQFETIHPFLDGNGRVGRLIIMYCLLKMKLAEKPSLYLSYFLKKYRNEYYDLLMKIRTQGAWEDWITFFLKGVLDTSIEASAAAKDIILLKDKLIKRLYENGVSTIYAVKLIDLLFAKPVVDVKQVEEGLKIHKDTANELTRKFEKVGILKEITGKERYKKYIFKDYIDIIKRGTQLD